MEAFEQKTANGPRAACCRPNWGCARPIWGRRTRPPLSSPLYLHARTSTAPGADQPFNSSIFRHVPWRSKRRVMGVAGRRDGTTKGLEELAGADMHRDGCSVCCCRRRCRGQTAACTPGTTNYFAKEPTCLCPFCFPLRCGLRARGGR